MLLTLLAMYAPPETVDEMRWSVVFSSSPAEKGDDAPMAAEDAVDAPEPRAEAEAPADPAPLPPSRDRSFTQASTPRDRVLTPRPVLSSLVSPAEVGIDMHVPTDTFPAAQLAALALPRPESSALLAPPTEDDIPQPTDLPPPAAHGPLDADLADALPREVTNLPPRYPEIARRRGIEGHVTIKLLIDAAGKVEEADVLEVFGHSSFEQAVRRMVSRWQFTAPTYNGKPTRVWAVKTIRFRLRG
jgi:protein TonB